MKEEEIIDQLRDILANDDIDRDHPITRNTSNKHASSIEVLLQHVAILVADLRFDAECSRRELFEIRDTLEFDNNS